jgi:hypothetical protein
LRKKIPTITRPDPAYAAALQQGDGRITEREEAERAAPAVTPADVIKPEARTQVARIESLEPALGPRGNGDIEGPTAETPSPRPDPHTTRKIDIRVNALARQEAALQACGVDPTHVVRAALRRAVKGWKLAPDFTPPSEEKRARLSHWQARTSLAVDAANLKALLRDHDPLDVLSKWALIRGQVEPRVWAEIDALLNEMADNATPPKAPSDL